MDLEITKKFITLDVGTAGFRRQRQEHPVATVYPAATGLASSQQDNR